MADNNLVATLSVGVVKVSDNLTDEEINTNTRLDNLENIIYDVDGQLETIKQQIANIEENGTGGGNGNITVDGIEGGTMDINTTNTFELKVADDLSYSNNILKLMSNGVPFGNGVTISINEGSSGGSSETNPYTKLYDYTLTEDSTDIKIGTDGLNIKEFKIYVLLTNQNRSSTYGYLKVNGVNSAFMATIVDDNTTSIQSFSFEISGLNDIKGYVIRCKYPFSNWNNVINTSCPKWWSGETITSLYVETYNSNYPILANSRIIIYGR